MTAYMMTAEQHAQIVDALEWPTPGTSAQVQRNLALAMLKAMKPVEPHSWYSAVQDESMTDKLRKDHERLGSYTHKHGKYDLPLYALGDTA